MEQRAVASSGEGAALLASIGLPGPTGDFQGFWRGLKKRFPRAAARVAHLFGVEPPRGQVGEPFPVYEAKHASLDLSLVITNQFFLPVQAGFLDWLLPRVNSPRVIVDLGCDDGALTLALARRFPEAEVIGLDRNARAVAHATEHAARLRVANARFVVGDALDPGAALGATPVDLVVASLVYHEATWHDPDPEPAWHVARLDERAHAVSGAGRVASWFAASLAKGGVVAWCERAGDATRRWRWRDTWRAFGLAPVNDSFGVVTASSAGEVERIPVGLFRPGHDARPLVHTLLDLRRAAEGATAGDRASWPGAWVDAVHAGDLIHEPEEVFAVLQTLGAAHVVESLVVFEPDDAVLLQTLRVGQRLYDLRLRQNLRGAQLALTTATAQARWRTEVLDLGGEVLGPGTVGEPVDPM